MSPAKVATEAMEMPAMAPAESGGSGVGVAEAVGMEEILVALPTVGVENVVLVAVEEVMLLLGVGVMLLVWCLLRVGLALVFVAVAELFLVAAVSSTTTGGGAARVASGWNPLGYLVL
jgi:hypothetical protein